MGGYAAVREAKDQAEKQLTFLRLALAKRKSAGQPASEETGRAIAKRAKFAGKKKR